ncbi:MAG: glycosyltransferase family 4 protein [Actinobacteria bacterium]|nr:MAG: glycosyltransferase family 4 protein [Actinomycetota bacterium]
MRVLYFGTYERDYPRNAQVISALRTAGVDVIERHASVWEGRRDNWASRWGTGLRLALAEARLRWHPRDSFDAVLVGYPGHFDVPRARRVAGKRPLVFNPLVSLHDTLVSDRGRFRRGSFAARILAAVDRRALRLSDLVVADTEANADFLAQVGEIPRSQVEVCLVGAEERLFRAAWRPDEPFRFLFVGKLIPLHGLETILEAARLAPELDVRVVGSGQLDELLEQRPANVEWEHWVEYERLPGEYWEAGCALGIFGTSEKARRVIPNKAYQALACGTPLITANTAAARELLTDGESALLVPPGDPAALAAAMRRLAGDSELAQRLSTGGRTAYEQGASEEVLGARWRSLIESLIA